MHLDKGPFQPMQERTIRMEDVRREAHSRRPVGILFCEHETQGKYATFPRSALGSEHSCCPNEHVVVTVWTCAAPLHVAQQL
eukprot:scaffold133_cov407-Prasinococcus_capsulatus_cf.AAC.3